MDQSGKKNFGWLFQHKTSLLIVMIAVIACAAVVVYFVKDVPPKKVVTVYVPPHLTVSEQVQYLTNHNEYQAAEQIWQQQFSKANSIQTREEIYFSQVSTALHFKQYKDALHYAKTAETLDPKSPAPYTEFAQIAQDEGNNALAKSYWRQAINHLNPNQPGYNLIVSDYKENITSLK